MNAMSLDIGLSQEAYRPSILAVFAKQISFLADIYSAYHGYEKREA
jgi:hypothetical protein